MNLMFTGNGAIQLEMTIKCLRIWPERWIMNPFPTILIMRCLSGHGWETHVIKMWV